MQIDIQEAWDYPSNEAIAEYEAELDEQLREWEAGHPEED